MVTKKKVVSCMNAPNESQMPAPQVRKLLIKTRKLWDSSSQLKDEDGIVSASPVFHTGMVLCDKIDMDAENFCYHWIRNSRLKRLKKGGETL